MNRYGVEVPMETVITYLDSDAYLTTETLYDDVARYEEKCLPAINLSSG